MNYFLHFLILRTFIIPPPQCNFKSILTVVEVVIIKVLNFATVILRVCTKYFDIYHGTV